MRIALAAHWALYREVRKIKSETSDIACACCICFYASACSSGGWNTSLICACPPFRSRPNLSMAYVDRACWASCSEVKLHVLSIRWTGPWEISHPLFFFC